MKQTIYYLIPVTMILVILQGCLVNADKNNKQNNATGGHSVTTPESSKDDQFIQKIADLKQRDPVKDAQQAIVRGDHKLIAKAGRGLSIPGIEASQYALLKDKCGLRYEHGFGDLLYGQHHRRYYSALHDYATQYNQTLLASCQSAKSL